MKKTIAILFVALLAASAFAERIVVPPGRSQAELNAIAAATGARPGRFPALVDKSTGRWVPIENGDAAAAEAALAAMLAGDAGAALAAEREARPAKLRGRERKVIEFLRAEGAMAADALSPTPEGLQAMYDAWDLLPGNQGDAKASKYERLMRPVRLRGLSDLDLYWQEDAP